MKTTYYLLLSLTTFLYSSCEEVIDLNLDSAGPRTVIEANLNDLSSDQTIRVSKTIAFGVSGRNTPIEDAAVVVRSSAKEEILFTYDRDGYYLAKNFVVKPGITYFLDVKSEGVNYVSQSQMPEYVAIDSLGITKEKVFNEERFYPTFTFNDPVGIKNHYLYEIAIKGSPIRFASTYNDKFNDGKYVTHEISDRTIDLELNDEVKVIRYCIDANVYQYWSDFQSANPGGAAPGNPTSNISNNALGYFSVASAKEHEFITSVYMEKYK